MKYQPTLVALACAMTLALSACNDSSSSRTSDNNDAADNNAAVQPNADNDSSEDQQADSSATDGELTLDNYRSVLEAAFHRAEDATEGSLAYLNSLDPMEEVAEGYIHAGLSSWKAEGKSLVKTYECRDGEIVYTLTVAGNPVAAGDSYAVDSEDCQADFYGNTDPEARHHNFDQQEASYTVTHYSKPAQSYRPLEDAGLKVEVDMLSTDDDNTYTRSQRLNVRHQQNEDRSLVEGQYSLDDYSGYGKYSAFNFKREIKDDSQSSYSLSFDYSFTSYLEKSSEISYSATSTEDFEFIYGRRAQAGKMTVTDKSGAVASVEIIDSNDTRISLDFNNDGTADETKTISSDSFF